MFRGLFTKKYTKKWEFKDYLKFVGKNFTRFDKVKKREYFSLFDKTKYDGISGVRENIMKIMHYYNKFKAVKVEVKKSTLIWRVLESLSPQFCVMRTSYNIQKGEWTVDEMIAIIIKEEESLKKAKSQSVQFATSTSGTYDMKKNYHRGKYHFNDKKKGKMIQHFEPKKKPFKAEFYKGNCKFSNKYGYKANDGFFLKTKCEK